MSKGNATTDWGRAELARLDKAVDGREISRATADTLSRLIPNVESGGLSRDGYKATADALGTLGVRSRPEGGHRDEFLGAAGDAVVKVEGKDMKVRDAVALHDRITDALDTVAKVHGKVYRVVINARPGKDDDKAAPAPKGKAAPAPAGKK